MISFFLFFFLVKSTLFSSYICFICCFTKLGSSQLYTKMLRRLSYLIINILQSNVIWFQSSNPYSIKKKKSRHQGHWCSSRACTSLKQEKRSSIAFPPCFLLHQFNWATAVTTEEIWEMWVTMRPGKATGWGLEVRWAVTIWLVVGLV